jgi:hypothetical protein
LAERERLGGEEGGTGSVLGWAVVDRQVETVQMTMSGSILLFCLWTEWEFWGVEGSAYRNNLWDSSMFTSVSTIGPIEPEYHSEDEKILGHAVHTARATSTRNTKRVPRGDQRAWTSFIPPECKRNKSYRALPALPRASVPSSSSPTITSPAPAPIPPSKSSILTANGTQLR